MGLCAAQAQGAGGAEDRWTWAVRLSWGLGSLVCRARRGACSLCVGCLLRALQMQRHMGRAWVRV